MHKRNRTKKKILNVKKRFFFQAQQNKKNLRNETIQSFSYRLLSPINVDS